MERKSIFPICGRIPAAHEDLEKKTRPLKSDAVNLSAVGYEFRQIYGSHGTHHWIKTGKNWGNAIWWSEDGQDYGYR